MRIFFFRAYLLVHNVTFFSSLLDYSRHDLQKLRKINLKIVLLGLTFFQIQFNTLRQIFTFISFYIFVNLQVWEWDLATARLSLAPCDCIISHSLYFFIKTYTIILSTVSAFRNIIGGIYRNSKISYRAWEGLPNADEFSHAQTNSVEVQDHVVIIPVGCRPTWYSG